MPGWGDWWRVEVLGDDRDGLVTHKRRSAGHELVEHCAERIEVRARGDLAAGCLLRRHITDSPNHHSRLRQARSVQGHCEPEVPELGGAAGREPDIAGLQIPVNYCLAVGELKALANLV